jgi:hypothetical protein
MGNKKVGRLLLFRLGALANQQTLPFVETLNFPSMVVKLQLPVGGPLRGMKRR